MNDIYNPPDDELPSLPENEDEEYEAYRQQQLDAPVSYHTQPEV